MMDNTLEVLRSEIKRARGWLSVALEQAKDCERAAAENRARAAALEKAIAEHEAALRALSSQSITIQAGER